MIISKHLHRRQFELAVLGITEKDSINASDYLERFNWDLQKGEYTNSVTQAMWLGYCLVGNPESKGNALTHYVIAKDVAGRPNFSIRPYTHQSYQGGYTELSRLANQHKGTKFILYKSISAIRIGESTGFVWPEPIPEVQCPCPNVLVKYDKALGCGFCVGQCPDTGPENHKISIVLAEK